MAELWGVDLSGLDDDQAAAFTQLAQERLPELVEALARKASQIVEQDRLRQEYETELDNLDDPGNWWALCRLQERYRKFGLKFE